MYASCRPSHHSSFLLPRISVNLRKLSYTCPFRLPGGLKIDFGSPGMLFSSERQSVTDVAARPIGSILKGQAVLKIQSFPSHYYSLLLRLKYYQLLIFEYPQSMFFLKSCVSYPGVNRSFTAPWIGFRGS
jgi:hypothetical protein